MLDIPTPFAPADIAEVLRKTGGMSEEVIAQVRARVNETMKNYPLFAY